MFNRCLSLRLLSSIMILEYLMYDHLNGVISLRLENAMNKVKIYAKAILMRPFMINSSTSRVLN